MVSNKQNITGNFSRTESAETNLSVKESISDEHIVQQILAGNINAFELVMRRYNQRLYRVARSILDDDDLAQDAIQQAYVAAFYKLGDYKSDGRLGAWLTRITINEALMTKRKPDNRYSITHQSLENTLYSHSNSNPVVNYSNRELGAIIESAIEKLPKDFRLVFVLREVQQLSIRETAECLEINETTVKTRLHRARHQMQQSLNQHIAEAGMQVFEFAGKRCDSVVKNVLQKLHK